MYGVERVRKVDGRVTEVRGRREGGTVEEGETTLYLCILFF